jgi:hypothetical protein
MNPEYLETDPETWLTKDYPNEDDLVVDNLTEIYIVIYKLERKGKDPEEVFTFTTDFEQAYKRFKLLPNTQGLLKRILTDDESLIKLAVDGTKPKVVDGDARLERVTPFVTDLEKQMEDAVISN